MAIHTLALSDEFYKCLQAQAAGEGRRLNDHILLLLHDAYERAEVRIQRQIVETERDSA